MSIKIRNLVIIEHKTNGTRHPKIEIRVKFKFPKSWLVLLWSSILNLNNSKPLNNNIYHNLCSCIIVPVVLSTKITREIPRKDKKKTQPTFVFCVFLSALRLPWDISLHPRLSARAKTMMTLRDQSKLSHARGLIHFSCFYTLKGQVLCAKKKKGKKKERTALPTMPCLEFGLIMVSWNNLQHRLQRIAREIRRSRIYVEERGNDISLIAHKPQIETHHRSWITMVTT